MKTILATTDFSSASINAVRYAANLALHAGAKLILFHVYHPPVMVSEGYIVTPSLEEMKEDSNVRLKQMADELHGIHGSTLNIEYLSKVGMAADEIDLLAAEKKADLVVMGMQTASAVSEKLFGSTTTSFLKKTTFPTLSIHQDVKYRVIQKISYASDYKEYDTKLPPILTDLLSLYSAKIDILHVFPEEGELPSYNEAIAGLKIEHMMEGIKHSFHAIVNEDVIEGINDYNLLNKIDLVVMTPRKHSIIETLFKESHTKRMAFHTNIPLLIIH